MATDLGKITITMEGDYDAEREYERLCCVRHLRATWVSTQTTLGNEPSDESEFWKKITDDGHTMTVVKYNIKVPISLWKESTAHEGYPYEASFTIDGITAASICSVLFELKEIISNNFAPVCDSYYGGITIYAKRLPDYVVNISSITANKYYNQDELITDSIRDSVNQNVENLAEQLNDITTNVIDVQNSTIFLKNIYIASTAWRNRSNTFSTDSYSRYADIRLSDYLTDTLEDFEDSYVATVIYDESGATSQMYSPVVETKNTGSGADGGSEYQVVRLYGKDSAKENDIVIPLIKLEKVSVSTLKKNKVQSDTQVSDT